MTSIMKVLLILYYKNQIKFIRACTVGLKIKNRLNILILLEKQIKYKIFIFNKRHKNCNQKQPEQGVIIQIIKNKITSLLDLINQLLTFYFAPKIPIQCKLKKNRKLDCKMRWLLENTSSNLQLKTSIIIRCMKEFKTKVASLQSRLSQAPLICTDGVKQRDFTRAIMMTPIKNRAAKEIVESIWTAKISFSNTKLHKSIMKERAVHLLKSHRFLHGAFD